MSEIIPPYLVERIREVQRQEREKALAQQAVEQASEAMIAEGGPIDSEEKGEKE